MPTLWNFLVGRVLDENTSDTVNGRVSVERRIDRKVAVSPLGLMMTPLFELLYKTSPDAFGRSSALRCPHYLADQGGTCGVWRHRNAVCATYFCKIERGLIGREFWGRVRQLFEAVEAQLARWCLVQLDIEAEVLKALFPRHGVPHDVLGPTVEPRGEEAVALHDRIWGKRWSGREREFYVECGRLVSSLSWLDVTRLCGPDVHVFVHLAQDAYAALLAENVPDRLRLETINIMPGAGAATYVRTYSATDMLAVPRKLLDVLHLFDGQRTTDAAVEEIANRTDIEMERSLLRKLVDFGVLTPVPATLTPSGPA